MTDLYLKATDKVAMDAALTTAGLLDDEGNYIGNVDVIGEIYKPTGNTLTDEDGMEYPEMQAIAGYHVNVRTDDVAVIDSLATITMTEPTTPFRVWA